jgi:hypothetical protein
MIHSQDITANPLAELLLTRAITLGAINAIRYALSPGDLFGDEVPRFPGPVTVLWPPQRLPGSAAKDCSDRHSVRNITAA